MVTTTAFTGAPLWDNKTAEQSFTLTSGSGQDTAVTFPAGAVAVSVTLQINAALDSVGEVVWVSTGTSANSGYVLQAENPTMTWRLGKSPVMNIVNGQATTPLVRIVFYFG